MSRWVNVRHSGNDKAAIGESVAVKTFRAAKATPETAAETSSAVAARASEEDNALERIAKYIPAEIVSAFTVLYTALTSMQLSSAYRPISAVALIGIFLVVTIIYAAKYAPAGPVRRAHLLVSTPAYLSWAYPISSGVLGDWYLPIVAFFGQAVVIALALIIVPKE